MTCGRQVGAPCAACRPQVIFKVPPLQIERAKKDIFYPSLVEVWAGLGILASSGQGER